MQDQPTSYTIPYLPVASEYMEIIENLIREERSGKVFFFNSKYEVDEAVGQITSLSGDQGAGMFIHLDSDVKVRIDRIITVFGKLGAAYDEYSAFSACGFGGDSGKGC